MIKRFEILANGTSMGHFQGVDAAAARESYATDAGYGSFADLLEAMGDDEDDVETREWKTSRHLMLTIRNDDEDAEIAAHLPDDGIESQQDYECADEAARQAVVDKLEERALELLGRPGTTGGDYTIMVLDYTDDGEDGLVLADVRETVDEIDEAA